MRLTPGLMAAAYSLLRETEPFRRWNLPDAEDVTFGVMRATDRMGDHVKRGYTHRIRLSTKFHVRVSAMLATMAHEMIHLHMQEAGAKRDSARHGPAFRRVAKTVLRHHPEFDPGVF